jgi:protein-S-isoprenylcysteine O-methyltransferase
MYAGGLIACTGSTIACGGVFVFLLIILGSVFLWRVGAEDLMARQFPSQYPDYRRRTPALLAFLW